MPMPSKSKADTPDKIIRNTSWQQISQSGDRYQNKAVKRRRVEEEKMITAVKKRSRLTENTKAAVPGHNAAITVNVTDLMETPFPFLGIWRTLNSED